MSDSNPPLSQVTGISKQAPDLAASATLISATVMAAKDADDIAPEGLLEALTLLHQMQDELAVIEPVLIAAARRAGVSWQSLAPALGVASRQAAERRYLRLAPTSTDAPVSTGDERVRAERDRRAGHRAVTKWANGHTADLRRLAGQITGLTDLDEDAAASINRLHRALADADASTLPDLLADTHQHLRHHPELAEQVDTVTTRTEQVRQDTQQGRDNLTL